MTSLCFAMDGSSSTTRWTSLFLPYCLWASVFGLRGAPFNTKEGGAVLWQRETPLSLVWFGRLGGESVAAVGRCRPFYSLRLLLWCLVVVVVVFVSCWFGNPNSNIMARLCFGCGHVVVAATLLFALARQSLKSKKLARGRGKQRKGETNRPTRRVCPRVRLDAYVVPFLTSPSSLFGLVLATTTTLTSSSS